MSLSPSWSESTSSITGGYASSTSESVHSKGFAISGSLKIPNCVRSIALPALHGWPSLKQWIKSSFEPSTGRFKAQLWKEFLITSVGSSAHASRIHCRIALLGEFLNSQQEFLHEFRLFPAIHRIFQCKRPWTAYSNRCLVPGCTLYTHQAQLRDQFSWDFNDSVMLSSMWHS